MVLEKEYKTIKKIDGPLVFVEKTHDVLYGELIGVNVEGEKKLGQVLETSTEHVVVQLFTGTLNVSKNSTVKFLNKPLTIKIDENIEELARE